MTEQYAFTEFDDEGQMRRYPADAPFIVRDQGAWAADHLARCVINDAAECVRAAGYADAAEKLDALYEEAAALPWAGGWVDTDRDADAAEKLQDILRDAENVEHASIEWDGDSGTVTISVVDAWEFPTVQDLAHDLYEAMGTQTRDSGEDFTTLRDDAPEWCRDVVRTAHGEFMPDDFRYEVIRDAAAAVADGDDPSEWADQSTDIYNGALTAWLASSVYRIAYVDDAVSDFGHSDRGVMGDIALGQMAERREVIESILSALGEMAGDA